MRTSLFIASACTLLKGARGDCSGYLYNTHIRGRSGCYEVYVSCWSKLGDSCDFEFDLPPWSAGYEMVKGDDITMTGQGHGNIHCGSDDGSAQWKNHDDGFVCQKDTPSPTLSPTTAPTASVTLNSGAVRMALHKLCASKTATACEGVDDPASLQSAEEECLSEADGLMASLIEEADAAGEEGEDGDDFEIEIAAAAGLPRNGNAVGRFASAAPTLLLVAAVALAAVSVVTSRFGLPRYNSNLHEYVSVPDATGP